VALDKTVVTLAQVTWDRSGICAGLVLGRPDARNEEVDEMVIEAAPVLRFTLGWPLWHLKSYFQRRHGKVVILLQRLAGRSARSASHSLDAS
jgi:hypothetical protein